MSFFDTILDGIEYDFREDDDEVQGHNKITREGDLLTITYKPFDDSPHPAVTETYKITRIG